MSDKKRLFFCFVFILFMRQALYFLGLDFKVGLRGFMAGVFIALAALTLHAITKPYKP